MLCKDLAEIVGGLIGLNPEIPDFHLTVHACYLQLRIEAEEGIATPGLIGLGRFQHIAVGDTFLSILIVSIGVVKSERISRLTGSTSYFPVSEIFLISSKNVRMFMNITS